MVADLVPLCRIISTDDALNKRLAREGTMDDRFAQDVKKFLDSVAQSGVWIVSPSGRGRVEGVLYEWSEQIRMLTDDQSYWNPVLVAPTNEPPIDFARLETVQAGDELTMLFQPTAAKVGRALIALERSRVLKLEPDGWGRMMDAEAEGWKGDGDRLVSATAGTNWSHIRFEEVLYALELLEINP